MFCCKRDHTDKKSEFILPQSNSKISSHTQEEGLWLKQSKVPASFFQNYFKKVHETHDSYSLTPSTSIAISNIIWLPKIPVNSLTFSFNLTLFIHIRCIKTNSSW